MGQEYWSSLAPEQRIAAVRCLADVGYSLSDIARAAGVSPAAASKWLSGRAAPSAESLQALYASLGDAAAKCLPEPPVSAVQVLRALEIIAKALRRPDLKDFVVRRLSELLPGLKPEIAYGVTKEDLELFKSKLDMEVSRVTRDAYLRYLARFLAKAGWVLTPESLQRVYEMGSPALAAAAVKALKKFIKTVVAAREPQIAPLLYSAIKTPRPRSRGVFKIPSLEEVRRVWEEAAEISPCAAAVWGLMAETGVRLDHLRRASISGLQLEKKRLLLGETAGPKRQPLIFLTAGAAKYIEEVHLPWRAKFLKMLRMESGALFPCREDAIYNWLKKARERAGLPWLVPKLLRKFNAQWLLDKGVDVADIAMLQGRALPSGLAITVEHYIADYERRLRAVFEAHAPKVFPE